MHSKALCVNILYVVFIHTSSRKIAFSGRRMLLPGSGVVCLRCCRGSAAPVICLQAGRMGLIVPARSFSFTASSALHMLSLGVGEGYNLVGLEGDFLYLLFHGVCCFG